MVVIWELKYEKGGMYDEGNEGMVIAMDAVGFSGKKKHSLMTWFQRKRNLSRKYNDCMR